MEAQDPWRCLRRVPLTTEALLALEQLYDAELAFVSLANHLGSWLA